MPEADVLAAPVEATKPQETELQNKVTPEVARGMFTAVGKKFFHPDATPNDDEARRLSGKSERDIPYRPLAEVSLDSRGNYWHDRDADSPRTFAQQNMDWNSETVAWIREDTNSPDPDTLAERNAALKSLGLDVENEDLWQSQSYKFIPKDSGKPETVTLVKGVEEFRIKYLREHSKVENFVSDIANDCRSGPGQPVDMDLLEKRLSAISGFMTVFGEDKSVDKLVHNFAISHGLLTQNETTKLGLSQKALEQMTQPMPDELRNGFEALSAKQLELDNIPQRAREIINEQKAQEDQAGKVNPVREKIDEAKTTALTHEAWEKLRTEEENIEHKFATGVYSSGKRDEEIKKLNEHQGGIMRFENADDLRIALELLDIPTVQINEQVKHESAHFDKAYEHGLSPVYEVQLSKGTGDTFTPHVMVRFNNPQNENEAENRSTVRDILLAPGLMHIGRNDAAGAGYDWTDVEDARKSVSSPGVSENIDNLNNSDNVEEGKHKIEYAVLDCVKAERLGFIKLFEDNQKSLPLQNEPPTPPPDTEATPSELLDEYLRGAIRASGAPESVIDRLNAFDEKDKELSDIFNQDIKISNGYRNINEIVTGILEDPKFSISQTTSLSKAIQDLEGGASIMLPIGNRHMGLLEPGPDAITVDKDNQLMAKVLDVKTGRHVILPLRSVLQSDVSYLNGVANLPDNENLTDDQNKDNKANLQLQTSMSSPIFIMQKAP